MKSDYKNSDKADLVFNEIANVADQLMEKMADVFTPGYQVEFDPEEAEKAGAFIEDAMTEQDAMESDVDLVNVIVPQPKRGE